MKKIRKATLTASLLALCLSQNTKAESNIIRTLSEIQIADATDEMQSELMLLEGKKVTVVNNTGKNTMEFLAIKLTSASDAIATIKFNINATLGKEGSLIKSSQRRLIFTTNLYIQKSPSGSPARYTVACFQNEDVKALDKPENKELRGTFQTDILEKTMKNFVSQFSFKLLQDGIFIVSPLLDAQQKPKLGKNKHIMIELFQTNGTALETMNSREL